MTLDHEPSDNSWCGFVIWIICVSRHLLWCQYGLGYDLFHAFSSTLKHITLSIECQNELKRTEESIEPLFIRKSNVLDWFNYVVGELCSELNSSCIILTDSLIGLKGIEAHHCTSSYSEQPADIIVFRVGWTVYQLMLVLEVTKMMIEQSNHLHLDLLAQSYSRFI